MVANTNELQSFAMLYSVIFFLYTITNDVAVLGRPRNLLTYGVMDIWP